MAEILALRPRATTTVAGAGSTLRAILGDTAAESAIGVRLPLLPPLDKLFGRGLRRGAVVAVDGDAARMSLAMALMAGVSGDGGWCGVVGVPSFGCVAASELGVRLDRLAMVPQPGPVWAEAMAAMLPGMDVLLVQPPGLVPGRLARRLAARARQARCTVLTLGPVWEGADVRISAVHQEWLGVGAGSGRLRSRRVRVAVSNRPGSELDVWLPAEGGGVAEVELTVQPPLSIVDRRVAAGAVDLDEAV